MEIRIFAHIGRNVFNEKTMATIAEKDGGFIGGIAEAVILFKTYEIKSCIRDAVFL